MKKKEKKSLYFYQTYNFRFSNFIKMDNDNYDNNDLNNDNNDNNDNRILDDDVFYIITYFSR